uniref:CD302 molecule n=1 Tax=Cyprinus carpio TaxID=7962 RepID=A0A8C2GSJ2_CYPCA
LFFFSFRADCPADGCTWLPFGLSCYHFVHGEEDIAKSYSLQDAKDMYLLTVKSAEENDFIITYSPSVWKGKKSVWLGMYYYSDEDVFKWHDDNSVLRCSNWEDGSSDDTDLPLLDRCVILHSNTGKWENVSCTDEPENGVVCKTSKCTLHPHCSSSSSGLFVNVVCAKFVSVSVVRFTKWDILSDFFLWSRTSIYFPAFLPEYLTHKYVFVTV